MKATDWQQHSVPRLPCRVVRKEARLELTSEKADGERIYRVTTASRPNRNRTRTSPRRRPPSHGPESQYANRRRRATECDRARARIAFDLRWP